jgi:hypothetical protein
MRRMTFDVGKRFRIRIEIMMAIVIVLLTVGGGVLVCTGMDWMDPGENFTVHHWMILLIHVFLIALFAFPAMLAAAFSNSSTDRQIQ